MEFRQKNAPKITPSISIYGTNRQNRRSLLRRTYKEAFLSYTEAKRAIREQDKETLKKFRSFTGFIKERIKDVQEEFRALGQELTEAEALQKVQQQAAEDFNKRTKN